MEVPQGQLRSPARPALDSSASLLAGPSLGSALLGFPLCPLLLL